MWWCVCSTIVHQQHREKLYKKDVDSGTRKALHVVVKIGGDTHTTDRNKPIHTHGTETEEGQRVSAEDLDGVNVKGL